MDNQVETLSCRKAEKEGQSADLICDALFRITLGVRFRGRSELQTSNVRKLLDLLVKTKREMSLNGLIATADRDYGSMELLQTLSTFGISTVMIMSEHNLRYHHFAGRSYLNPSMCDEYKKSNEEKG